MFTLDLNLELNQIIKQGKHVTRHHGLHMVLHDQDWYVLRQWVALILANSAQSQVVSLYFFPFRMFLA